MSYVKTEWINNSPPKINQTNLNKIEEQIFENTNNIGTLSSLKTSDRSNLVNAINEFAGKTVWTNGHLDSSFPQQTITISSEDSMGYTYYEIVYEQSITRQTRNFTTGKIRYDMGSILSLGNGVYRAYDVEIQLDSSRKISFENSYDREGNISNTQVIPVKIIFYKGEY